MGELTKGQASKRGRVADKTSWPRDLSSLSTEELVGLRRRLLVDRGAGDPLTEPAALRDRLRLREIDLELQGRELRAARQALALSRAGSGELAQRAPLGSLRDITPGQVAEARRADSESFAQGVLNALSTHIAVLDGCGRIISVNDAWRQFARENGAAPAVVEGTGVDYLSVCQAAAGLEAAYGEQATEGIRSVLSGRQPSFALEYPCHSATEQRWLLMSATRLGGGSPAVVVAHTDVTERKRMEDERLRRGQALARASRLNSLSILASSLVHELTQPLTAASLYSEALASIVTQGGSENAELAEAVRALHVQIKRASDIVHRLRSFIRGRTACVAAVPLRDIITDALRVVEPLARGKQVDLTLDPFPRNLDVEGDPAQIEQVMVNLLCNAVEAVDAAGKERREVRVRVTSNPSDIKVTVEDTGTGLSPEAADRVFDAFESSSEAGTGVGLAICREIVEGHRGRIWADPQTPVGGASFHFTLPLPAKRGSRRGRANTPSGAA
jgi:two-component system sensor kinase FixL